jgi:hypothetical protein
MRKGNLTREQAVSIIGRDAVDQVDAENCDYTNRVGYNGSCQGDDDVEFAASVETADGKITAYYYQTAQDVDAISLYLLNWTVYGYEVV